MPNVAVVAGGAGGMVLAAAHVVGRDSAVVISDVDPDRLRAAERELSEAGIVCTATVCDITDRGSVAALVTELVRLCNLGPWARRPQLAYVLSKNFVIWHSKAMAADFGAKGARVLSVSPGSFDTAMGQLEKNVAAGALAQLGAFKRFGHRAEIAEFLAFCASDKPGYLTGTDIVCDGGVTAAMRMADMLELARRQ